jgi:hypothetical protein
VVGGPNLAADFTIALNDGTGTSISGSEAPGAMYTYDAGTTFNPTETNTVLGYTASYGLTHGTTSPFNQNQDSTTSCSGTIQDGVTFVCTITNTYVKASPGYSTVQTVTLADSITISNIRPGANDKATTVTFTVFTNSSCTTAFLVNGVAYSQTTTLTYNTITPPPVGTKATSSTTATTVPSGVYYWKVHYAGDSFNNGFDTTCGLNGENTTVSIVNQ